MCKQELTENWFYTNWAAISISSMPNLALYCGLYHRATTLTLPIKATSGLFLRQHHPKKQTTRGEQMPPGAA